MYISFFPRKVVYGNQFHMGSSYFELYWGKSQFFITIGNKRVIELVIKEFNNFKDWYFVGKNDSASKREALKMKQCLPNHTKLVHPQFSDEQLY